MIQSSNFAIFLNLVFTWGTVLPLSAVTAAASHVNIIVVVNITTTAYRAMYAITTIKSKLL